MTDDCCPICGKPISDGEPIYTIQDKAGRIRHYDCWDKEYGPEARRKVVDDMHASLSKIRNLIKKMR